MYQNQKNYSGRVALMMGAAGLALLLSDAPSNAQNIEGRAANSAYFGILSPKTWLKPDPTKSDLYDRMKRDGWEFLTNYNPKLEFTLVPTVEGGIPMPNDRKTPETPDEVLKKFAVSNSRYEFRVERIAYDEKDNLVLSNYSVWKRAKTQTKK